MARHMAQYPLSMPLGSLVVDQPAAMVDAVGRDRLMRAAVVSAAEDAVVTLTVRFDSQQEANLTVAQGNGAWLLGTGGAAKILRSVDDGVTWTKVLAPDVDQVNAIAMFDSQAIAIGSVSGGASQVYLSEDSGTTWTQSYTHPSGGTFLCAGISEAPVCLGDSHGDIYRSEDGRAPWTQVFTSPANRITAIAANYNEGTWCAGSGYSGQIFRSTDDGISWTEVHDSSLQSIEAMASDLNGTWCAGGSNGTLLRSADDGITWTTVLSAGGPPVRAVSTRGRKHAGVPWSAQMSTAAWTAAPPGPRSALCRCRPMAWPPMANSG